MKLNGKVYKTVVRIGRSVAWCKDMGNNKRIISTTRSK